MRIERKRPALSRRSLLKGMGAAALVSPSVLASAARAQDLAGLIKTATPGTLTIATSGAMPMVDLTDGGFAGVDGEMISRIAQKLGLTIQPMVMDWGATVEAVRSGRADMVLGNMNWTTRRAEVLGTSNAIYYYTAYLAKRRGTVVTTPTMTVAEVTGHSIGTVIGAAPQAEIRSMDFASETKFYDSTDACIRDILAGRLDLGALDGMEAAYLFQKNPDWDIELVELVPDPAYPMLSDKIPSVFGINPALTGLYDAVNAGLDWLWDSGQVSEILASYGLTSPGFVTPPAVDGRIGVDRNADGTVAGLMAHETVDFTSLFQ